MKGPKREVLVLNADYSPLTVFPLSVIEARDAVRSVFNDYTTVVTEYDEYIATPNLTMKWPAIIAKKDFVKMEKLAILTPESLWYRDEKKCAYCSCTVSKNEITRDHVIPEAKGGKTTWTNLVLACPSCNQRKGMKDAVKEWEPKNKAYRPTYYQLLEKRKKFPLSVPHESWVDFLGVWEGKVSVIGS